MTSSTTEPLRAVFDTNIWISAELYQGNPWRCVQAAKAGKVQLFHCAPMIAELADKLRLRFAYPENHIHAVIYAYRHLSTSVEIIGTLRAVADDPTDDKFVECALVAGAAFIVSGDRHLLSLGDYQAVQVMTASDFLARLNQP